MKIKEIKKEKEKNTIETEFIYVETDKNIFRFSKHWEVLILGEFIKVDDSYIVYLLNNEIKNYYGNDLDLLEDLLKIGVKPLQDLEGNLTGFSDGKYRLENGMDIYIKDEVIVHIKNN